MTKTRWNGPLALPDGEATPEELVELRRLMRRYGVLYEMPIMSSGTLLQTYRVHAVLSRDPEYSDE